MLIGMDVTTNELMISRWLLDVPDHRRYGYELMQQTGLGSASMYQALHRMEQNGWLTSYLEPLGVAERGRRRRGGRRRFYELTDEGREHMTRQVRDWLARLRGDPPAAA